MRSLKSSIIKHSLVFVFFLTASLYVTYPLIFHLKDFSPGNTDELYITWILNWNIHALSTNIFDLFNANIYYPYQFSVSFSDLHLASSLIAFLPVTIFQEPLMAYTVNIILSFTLLGFFTYLLLHSLTSEYYSGIIGGSLFAFSTYTLMKTMHLQVLSIYWIPMALLCYLAYLKGSKIRFFILTMVCFYLQFINSFLPAYFLLFLLIILTTYTLITKQIKTSIIFNKKIFFVCLLVFMLAIPIIYPYYYTSRTFNYSRDIREAIHTANRPEYFFYSYGRSIIGPTINSLLYKHSGPFLYDGYRGFVSITLTIILIAYLLIKKGWKYPKYLKLFTIIAISTYILSLGPALQWGGRVLKLPFIIPLPYALFYYLAPGFKGLRNSGRLEIFEIFAFSIAIGIFLSSIFRKKSIFLKSVLTIIICGLILGEFSFPMQFSKIKSRKEFPEVYNYIASTPLDSIIAEFPIYNWYMMPHSLDEITREYYSTAHFRRTLNGAGGFSPYPWQNTVTTLAEQFPNEQAQLTLKKLHINYIIVHEKEFDTLNNLGYKVKDRPIPSSKTVTKMLLESRSVELVKMFNHDKVYKIIYE